MALNITTGFTDDGLVFLLMEGQQTQFSKPLQTTVTMEPDMAHGLGKKLLESADKAMKAKKRVIQPLGVGDPITIKR